MWIVIMINGKREWIGRPEGSPVRVRREVKQQHSGQSIANQMKSNPATAWGFSTMRSFSPGRGEGASGLTVSGSRD